VETWVQAPINGLWSRGGEPYVTTTNDRSRVQHPSTPLPPTIQQNCYTGSSECTPRYLLTHQNLEMIPNLGRRPRKTTTDREKSPCDRQNPESQTVSLGHWTRESGILPMTKDFPRSTPTNASNFLSDRGDTRSLHSSTGDLLGHHTNSSVTDNERQ